MVKGIVIKGELVATSFILVAREEGRIPTEENILCQSFRQNDAI